MFRKTIFFILGFLFIPSCFAEVFITSVFPNTSDDSNLEYIELYNSSGSSVDISGYTLSDLSEKSYTFGSGTFLESKVFTQFLRTETKIILNNTNEGVLLKDPLGELVDTIEYKSSVKGEKITFLEKLEKEGFLSQEVFISGEAIISDEVDIGKGNTLPTEIFIPEVSWNFQQPSYIIEETTESLEYTCDTTKEECKINFDFRTSFTEVGESGYECEIDFGFFTGQEQKCNPNTITFPEGEYEIRIKIISQAQRDMYTKKKIKIIHLRTSIELPIEIEENTTTQDITSSQDHSGDDILEELFFLDSLLFDFQSPSYVFSSTEDVYFCDREKDTCRVNFDFRSTFSSKFPEGKYSCILDFGFFTGQEQKCNPNTIEVPLGEHLFHFQIYERESGKLATERHISVRNLGTYKESEKPLSVSRGYKPESFIDIEKPEIFIQSGLEEREGKFYCLKEKCLVNLEYKKQDPGLKCFWNFGDGMYKESSLTRCNPGIVEYSGGIHRITLKVYQANNKTNYFENKITFENFYEAGEEKEETIIISEENIKRISPEISLDIILQGKIGQNKKLFENTLVCMTKEFCSVNLTSALSFSGSSDIKNPQYFWDFGNSESFIGDNPKSIKYPFGEYRIRLLLKSKDEILQEKEFFLSVISLETISKKVAVNTPEVEDIFIGSLSFVSLLPNPAGNDIREWIEVQNTGLTDIELSQCYIKNGSKKSKFSAGVLYPFESQKIFRVFSNFSLGNSKDEIELWCGDILQDTFSWSEKILENGVLKQDGEIFIQNYDFKREDFESLEDYKTFVEKTWKVNVRKLKSGVKITGETLAYQDINIIASQGREFGVTTDADGLFEILSDTQITLGELYFSFDFQDREGNEFSFTDNTLLQISSQDRSNFLAKYIKKTRKKKAVSSSEKETLLSIEQAGKEEEIITLSLFYKIIFIFGLSFFGLLCCIFLLPYNEEIHSMFDVEGYLFTVRQRVNLLV